MQETQLDLSSILAQIAILAHTWWCVIAQACFMTTDHMKHNMLGSIDN